MNNSIIKENVKTMTKFQLVSAKKEGRLLPHVLLLNLIISIIITQISSVPTTGGSIDIVTLSMALFLAPAAFMYSFRMALMNGVSRKAVMISTLISFIIISMTLAVVTVLFMYIGQIVANPLNISQILFNSSPIQLLPWLFVVFFFVSVFITFIILFVTQTKKKVRLVTMALFFVVPSILVLINIISNNVIGRIFSFIGRMLLGHTSSGLNPFLSMLSFLLLTFIFSIGVYFFGKRYVINKK